MPPALDYLNLSQQEAIDYFRQKIAIPTENWKQFDAEQHDFAYTIAGLTRAELLESMRWLLEQAIAEGNSFETFNKQFKRLVQRRGWTPDPLPAGPSDWRMRVIFETPIRRSYGAGRLKQMRDPDVLAKRPYWIWKHGDSPSPRMHHLELHDQVFRADDPFWDIAYPPCGYGCKCRCYSIGDRHVTARGLSVGTPPDAVTVAQKGFRRSPGTTPEAERQEVLDQGINRLSPPLAEQVRKDMKDKGLMGDEGDRKDAAERQDAQRIWVKDARVKGGGYYRRSGAAGSSQKKEKKEKGWLIWFDGRRTPVAVAATSKRAAIKKAQQAKKRGGDGVVKVRQATEKEREKADKGQWLRIGPNDEKPGDGNLRGFGPPPKSHRKAVERQDDRRIWVDDDSVENGGYYRRQKDAKTPEKVSPFVSKQDMAGMTKVFDPRHSSGINDSFFVEDQHQTRRVLKISERPHESAAEVLVSELGNSIGAKVNQVRLVPTAHNLMSGRSSASLHDLVPGRPCRSIHQGSGSRTNIQLGGTPQRNRDAFGQALANPDLARIMALDAFTGNDDRHTGNLFYDPKKGYHGIDHGYAFTSTPAAELDFALQDCDEAELQALVMGRGKNLKVLVSSLEKLTQKNSPQSIANRLKLYANAASGAGFKPSSEDYKSVRERQLSRENYIELNHKKSLSLIKLLKPYTEND